MKLLNILYQVKQTNSRIEKEKLIIENDSNILKKIFYYSYEPLKVFYIQKVPDELIDFNNKNLEIENIHEELFQLLEKLSNRIYTGNKALQELMNICNNVSNETFQLVLKILNKDLEIGIAEKTLRKIYGDDFITDFGVQLANKYFPGKEYKTEIWFATPKLDGLRGVMRNGVLLSRNGKPLYGFENIEEELDFLQKKYGISLFDGEMYSKNIPFQKIQSIVMQQKISSLKDKIKYYVFAVDILKGNFKNTEMMYKFLSEIEKRHELNHIVFVPSIKIKNDRKIINRLTEQYVKFGYEGSMLRHPEKYISIGRDDNLLKRKLMKEADLKIIKVIEGKKKNEGKMGAVLCEGVVEGEKVITEVGSGFSDKEREEVFNNKEEYEGKAIISVEYQNLTDSKESLRIATKVSIKKDR